MSLAWKKDQVAQKASFLRALEWAVVSGTKPPQFYEDLSDKDNKLIDRNY